MDRPETKICQNCKQNFVIEPDDFGFYEKMNVPPPTFCPDCRRQRRLSWRNDLNLYPRACGLCKKSIISLYSKHNPAPVYCVKCWWSDKWDPKVYGQDYDFSKNFFEQFKTLQNKVPALTMVNDDGIGSINCEYTQDFAFGKNCYMVFVAWKIENCLYSYYLIGGKELVDTSYVMTECEYLYDTVYTEKCYQCRNIYYSIALTNCNFCYDCRDSSDCFMCVGLRHKRHCFKNKQYSKEEYEKVLAGYRLDTWSGVQRAWDEFKPMLLEYPRKFSYMRNCVNCTGDVIMNGKNSKYIFYTQRPENCKWIDNADTPKDSYDLSVGGELEQCYEGITPDHSYRSRFAIFSWVNRNAHYVDGCHSSENIFGCCGLKKSQYCILNKQYSKEEYEKLVPLIIKQMNDRPYIDARGMKHPYGEFFPTELSYFGYNGSVAQDYFPLTREKILNNGWGYQDVLHASKGKETLKTGEIPDSINDIQDSILNEVLTCQICSRNYKIVPQELSFYRRFKIPIPRFCFFCRNKKRLEMRNPSKLWHRKCTCAGEKSENGVYTNTVEHFHKSGRCPNEFETSYAPKRPEIVYCEQCYNAEIV